MKILVAGDFCPQNRLYQYLVNLDFENIFPERLITFVQSVEYSIANLECVIADDIYVPISKCDPNLTAPSVSIDASKYGGFMC